MKELAILGGGSWGTALAIVLAPRFARVRLWVYEADLAERIQRTRDNDLYLPGFPLPANVEATNSLAAAVRGAGIVAGVMPSHHARRLYTEALAHVEPQAIVVSATKGLEEGTLLRMSEVIEAAAPAGLRPRVAVLSGPTFAREVARGEPTAVVVASADPRTAGEVQAAFSGPTFRLYANSDVTGVEVAAALKNVIAIGAGVCHGLGLGSNAMAALITRGLAEITRLAAAMGARPATLAGLAGLGDLVLTCTGELSRNRTVGLRLAEGWTLERILASMRMVAEGIKTTHAAVALAGKLGVELPIASKMHEILCLGKPPRQAIRELMERPLKVE